MDHRYIDEHSLADRYLDRVLERQESVEFEAHLVDCQECRDRLLLAEMFHARNGVRKPSPGRGETPSNIRLGNMRLAGRVSLSQVALVFTAAAVSAIALLLAAVAIFLWAAHHGIV